MRYNSGMAARDDEKVKRTIASNIAHYRKECNLTQDELAELIFYSGKSVSKWERGDGVPDICVLVALADIFGVTINDMLAENIDKGCFYFSANDHFDRSRDGAHPTRASAHLWMDRVVKWMYSNGAHPIQLKSPGEGTARADHLVIYQPPA